MKKILAISVLATSPSLILAKESSEGFSGLLSSASSLLNQFYTLLFAAIGVAFAWGVFQYIWGEEKGTEEAKKKLVWPIVGLVVLMSVWGIVKIVQQTVGIENVDSIKAPALPGINNPSK